MAGRDDGSGTRRGGRAPITAHAMGDYVARLRKGENYAEAARGAGYDVGSFWRLRKRDPQFRAMCDEAIARSSGVRFVHGGARRKLQLRRTRNTLFTPDRKAIFLARFAGTGNTAEAAAEAGVCEATVDKHRREDPDFERRFLETLDQAYVKLEADLVARRVAAQRRLRDVEPTGEPEPEFERAMKLLKRWDRRQGPPDSRAVGQGRQKRWDFADAVILLEKKLRNMGIPIEPLPPGHERPDGDLPLPPSPGRRGEGGGGGDEEERET
ncbi:MAG TPA: hypothetical protein VFP12_16210 [Allosphingosinicella sp.]|nr:hypothetical protein [Allosphingosinicella sp.]